MTIILQQKNARRIRITPKYTEWKMVIYLAISFNGHQFLADIISASSGHEKQDYIGNLVLNKRN